MPKINVEKPFRLRKDNGEVVDFEPGEQTVDKETADHWFVKAHLVGASSEPKEGSYEYAQRNRALKSEEDQAVADQSAADAEQSRVAAEARAAEMMAKTEQAISAVAQQAQDVVTKDDPQASNAVTDLPAIPLSAGAPAADQSAADAGNVASEQAQQ
ncbi:hypothetical protein G6L15_08575 [Agrobacterium rhizogenes]|uniref:STY1053 family phage-associated protein n=1 Tax=Rhizobium rhizogenes TaxID=359 RepID=UPI001572ED9B|nr:hypothetical protein [Rhizobium rhizogenes]NTG86199.1 hypothetical protein [Rhizobium rhizogenes]